ncbi:hypothetical protein [Martelella sp. AMO21009]
MAHALSPIENDDTVNRFSASVSFKHDYKYHIFRKRKHRFPLLPVVDPRSGLPAVTRFGSSAVCLNRPMIQRFALTHRVIKKPGSTFSPAQS